MAYYLVADDVLTILNLTGDRSYLFDQLCAHEVNLATHCAVIYREEEGGNRYVLLNAHPVFNDAVALTGMINEPCAPHPAAQLWRFGLTYALSSLEQRGAQVGQHEDDAELRLPHRRQRPGARRSGSNAIRRRFGCVVHARRAASRQGRPCANGMRPAMELATFASTLRPLLTSRLRSVARAERTDDYVPHDARQVHD